MQQPNPTTISEDQVSFDQLKEKQEHIHVLLLVEDWNEPEHWVAHESTILEVNQTRYITTAVSWTFEVTPKLQDWTTDVVVAAYISDKPTPVDVAVYNLDGDLCYTTGGQGR